MRKGINVMAIIFVFTFSFAARAQTEPEVLKLKTVSVVSNSVNGFYLLVNFRLDLDSETIDDEYFFTNKSGFPDFHITYQGTIAKGSCIVSRPFVSPDGFGVKVSGFTNKQIEYFLAKDNQIGVVCDKDFTIRYYKAGLKKPKESDYKYGVVRADDINRMIKGNLVITDSDRSSYITAINAFYLFENKIDIGLNLGGTGSASSFILSASIRNKYAPSKFLSCGEREDEHHLLPRAFWSLSARLSSDFSDSLTSIIFSPVNLSWTSRNFARELDVKLSNESDQTFTSKRVAVDESYRCIIPNLVNFTTPDDNRLRLKPIVNFGIKEYYDYSNGITAFSSEQGYAKLYYYIPVYNNYALIINGDAFYDVSRQRNPQHKIAANYSVVVASELGASGYKVMLKYERGTSDISYKTGQSVDAGVLMDFMKEKKK